MRTYVAEGQVKLIFWDNLDSSERATYLHTVANCAGQQDHAYFWRMHDYLFRNQSTIVRADNEQIIQTAVNFGVDRNEFDLCLSSGEGLAAVEALEAIAEERGVRSRPIFDINGVQMFGAQPFSAFSQVIEEALK